MEFCSSCHCIMLHSIYCEYLSVSNNTSTAFFLISLKMLYTWLYDYRNNCRFYTHLKNIQVQTIQQCPVKEKKYSINPTQQGPELHVAACPISTFIFFRVQARRNEHVCLYTFFPSQRGSQTVVQFAFFLSLVWTSSRLGV